MKLLILKPFQISRHELQVVALLQRRARGRHGEEVQTDHRGRGALRVGRLYGRRGQEGAEEMAREDNHVIESFYNAY